MERAPPRPLWLLHLAGSRLSALGTRKPGRGASRLPAVALNLSGAPSSGPLQVCSRPQETHWSWTQSPSRAHPTWPVGAPRGPCCPGASSVRTPRQASPQREASSGRPTRRREAAGGHGPGAGGRHWRPPPADPRRTRPAGLARHPRGAPAIQAWTAAWSRTTVAKAASCLPQAPSLDSSHGSQGQRAGDTQLCPQAPGPAPLLARPDEANQRSSFLSTGSRPLLG